MQTAIKGTSLLRNRPVPYLRNIQLIFQRLLKILDNFCHFLVSLFFVLFFYYFLECIKHKTYKCLELTI